MRAGILSAQTNAQYSLSFRKEVGEKGTRGGRRRRLPAAVFLIPPKGLLSSDRGGLGLGSCALCVLGAGYIVEILFMVPIVLQLSRNV